MSQGSAETYFRGYGEFYVSFFRSLSLNATIETVLARDSMLSALYAIARPSVRPSVCLSVRHTGGSVENG